MNYFTIQGYDKKVNPTKDGYQLSGVVELGLSAKDEKDAIKGAKKMLKKNGYRIARVVELCDHSGQEELFKELIKAIKQIK